MIKIILKNQKSFFVDKDQIYEQVEHINILLESKNITSESKSDFIEKKRALVDAFFKYNFI